MSTDVIISEVPARTYTVPAVLVAAIGERAALDKVYDTLGSDDEAARIWAERIIAGIERDRERQEEAVLASIAYDPDEYFYWGLTASGDDDLIYAIGRLKRPDTNIGNAEILTEKTSWRPISSDISSDPHQAGIAMTASLLAFTASAFAEGMHGVQMSYGNPLTFLPTQPMLASGTMGSKQDGNVYAIVDGTDTTAVMELIMIKDGPEVFRRDGGAWVLDNSILDSLQSTNPPPIVELTGSTLSSVLEQVDNNKANQLEPDSTGQASEGSMLIEEPIKSDPKKAIKPSSSDTSDQAIPTKKPSDSPSKDTYASNQNKSQLKDGSSSRTAALLARYDDIETMTASIRGLSSDVADAMSVRDAKLKLLNDATALRASLELRESQIHKIVLPALLADAASVHDATPNQRKATHLRKYWVRGKGAVKIRWGTEGDFTRCVSQLQKYLGARAKGYCAKRHKETVGYWPGDKRNTGPQRGNTGQKSRA
ncbi:hypothetical protein SEA_FORZA_82 [Gordonia phage Forza]|uniref:Capsid maturation protease n=1 Tax=Gordonia phage Forza TaxID=2571247 RepID=A0A650EZG1_9CAUD|nr:hypothetical protein PP303_gp082 [Gordonia phage Forza]QEM41551.1 hypothetical protein SEA_BOOPY_82 [Gordonia phage Boopy]QGT55075.1 hypothetical protein SEA_FORZA_82 [Gordonia phage Forza]UXE04225.1 hypothetical protein SEA_BLUENGOLD_81 [Gordonia phage BlueNGold]